MRRFVTLAASAATFISLASPAWAESHTIGVNKFSTSGIPFVDFGDLLNNVLALIFFVAALASFIFIIIGGIQWITAGGDKASAQSARDRITAAVIGLLIVVSAFAITVILNATLGIDLFNFQFPTAPNTAGTAGT